MSIWKSPVFYFGILLLAVVSFALAAPYVIDWNSYKPDLQAYGKKLTGRDVTIAGDVQVRLFPTPSLTADDVTVGNPAEISAEPFLQTKRLHMRISLGSLLNGTLNVEAVEVTKPRITLVRSEAGHANWFVGPQQGLALAPLLAGVRLDSIQVVDGTLRAEDREKNVSLNLSGVEAVISATALEGPWRLSGTALWRDTPVAMTFTSSPYQVGQPFRFGLKASPKDRSIPTFAIDGGLKETGFVGMLRVVPQSTEGEKGSAEGGLKPLALEAKLTASRDRADLEDIRIAPVDARDSGTLIEGRASVAYDKNVNALIELTAPRINLDSILGAESLEAWRAGGFVALAQAVLREMPEKLQAEFLLDAGVVTVGGETLPKVVLKAQAQQGFIRISEGRAGLPGRTAFLFTGDIKRRDGVAELIGKLDMESQDLRELVRWLMPQHRSKIDENWIGSRGRLKLVSNLGLGENELRLSAAKFELDQQAGQAEFKWISGALPALHLRLDMDAFDIDQMLPEGLKGENKAFDAVGWLAYIFNRQSEFDAQVSLDARSLTVNGVTAGDVALEATSSLSGFDLKLLEIGSVGGARVEAKGTVLNLTEGPSGEIHGKLKATELMTLAQLLGFQTIGAKWAKELLATDLALTMRVAGAKDAPKIELLAKGQSGVHAIDIAGTISELSKASDSRIQLKGKITAEQADATLALLGVTAKSPQRGPGQLNFDFAGTKSSGFASRIDGDIAGTRVTFDGILRPSEAYGAMAGTVNVVSPDAAQVFKLFGLPMTPRTGPLQMSVRMSTEAGILKGEQMFGAVNGAPFKGNFAFDAEGKLSGTFETGELSLAELSSLAVLPWDGSTGSLQDNFARQEDGLFHGNVSILPAKLRLPFSDAITEAVVTIDIGKTRRVGVLVPTRPDVGFSMLIEPGDGTVAVTLEGKTFVDLAQALMKSDGTSPLTGKINLSGTFKGEGRSPATVLARLSGAGTYQLDGVTFNQFNPQALLAAAGDKASATELEAALKNLELGAGFSPGQKNGAFSLTDGKLATDSIVVSSDTVTTEISVSSDLALSEIKVASAVKLVAAPDLPPAVVSYEGPVGELEKQSSTSALAAKLGHEILARDLAELEKLKAQQEQALKLEEAKRAEDQLKFEAYQAQKAELRLRIRELKIHADERKRLAAIQAAEREERIGVIDGLNKQDLAKAKLQLAVFRKLAEPASVVVPKQEDVVVPPPSKLSPDLPVQSITPVKPEEAPQPKKKRGLKKKAEKPKEESEVPAVKPDAVLAPATPDAINPVDPALQKKKVLFPPKPDVPCEGLYC